MGDKGDLRRVGRRCVLLLCMLLCASACVTSPPYQEMSDARQAIAAAEEAGAAEKAPDLFAQAMAYLKNAKDKMDKRSFNIARSQAVLAHEKAVAAMRRIKRQERLQQP